MVTEIETKPLILSSTVASPSLNVVSLHDSDIEGLVDRYVFRYNSWCYGDYEKNTGYLGYRCDQCGAIEEQPVTWREFGKIGHPRLVPQYTVEQIIAKMRHQDKAAQLGFVAALRRALGTTLQSVIFGLTSRNVGIAAMQALCIVDERGDVQGSEVARENA